MLAVYPALCHAPGGFKRPQKMAVVLRVKVNQNEDTGGSGLVAQTPQEFRGRDQLGLSLERRKNQVHEDGIPEAGKVAAKAEMNWDVCVHTHSCTSVCECLRLHMCVFMYVCTPILEESMEVCWGWTLTGQEA